MATSVHITLNPDVVCSTLPEGGVLLDLDTKQYFALNQTGVAIWQFLEDGGSLAQLRTGLDVAAGAELDAFATALIEQGLAISVADSQSTEPPPSFAPPSPWTAPSVTLHGRPLAQVILSPFDPTVPIPE